MRQKFLSFFSFFKKEFSHAQNSSCSFLFEVFLWFIFCQDFHAWVIHSILFLESSYCLNTESLPNFVFLNKRLNKKSWCLHYDKWFKNYSQIACYVSWKTILKSHCQYIELYNNAFSVYAGILFLINIILERLYLLPSWDRLS